MTTIDILNALEPQLKELRRAAPKARVAKADALREQLQAVQSLVVKEKSRAVRQMREQGMSLTEIASELGVSISRIKQIEEGPRRTPPPTVDQQADKLRRQLARLEREAVS